jgi:hypothetical protein
MRSKPVARKSPLQEGLPRHGYFTFDGIIKTPIRGFPVFDSEAFMAFAELTPRTFSHNLPFQPCRETQQDKLSLLAIAASLICSVGREK